MANCQWCGKTTKINQFNYCDDCNSEIRNGIIKNKESLESLANQAHCDLLQAEKDSILQTADAAARELSVYKDRAVPFFKSNIDEMLQLVKSRLELPKGSVVFKSLKVEGRQGKSLILEKSTIRIVRRGTLIAAAREKSIPIKQIVGVEIKKPGALIVGYVQIQTAGQNVGSSTMKYTGGAADAVNDENSVLFANQDDYNTAIKIKEYIENYNA